MSPPPAITHREEQVLQALAEGFSVPEIAECLHIGVTTVRTHVRHINSKLGTRTQAGAVGAAYRRGLLVANSPDAADDTPTPPRPAIAPAGGDDHQI